MKIDLNSNALITIIADIYDNDFGDLVTINVTASNANNSNITNIPSSPVTRATIQINYVPAYGDYPVFR